MQHNKRGAECGAGGREGLPQKSLQSCIIENCRRAFGTYAKTQLKSSSPSSCESRLLLPLRTLTVAAVAAAALPVLAWALALACIVFFFALLPCHVSHIENCAQLATASLHSRTFGLWLPAILAEREQSRTQRSDKPDFKEGFTYARAQESIVHTAHCTCCLHSLSLWHAHVARSKYLIEHCCAATHYIAFHYIAI